MRGAVGGVRRQPSVRSVLSPPQEEEQDTDHDRSSGSEFGQSGDVDAGAAGGVVATSAISAGPANGRIKGGRPAQRDPLDRAVSTRTQYRITLSTSFSGAGDASSSDESAVAAADNGTSDQHGWSSPHGEPYRPLGKPDLGLKFSPRLANGTSLLQNTHRMKSIESGLTSKSHDARNAQAPGSIRSSDKAVASPPVTAGSMAAAKAALHHLFPLQLSTKKWPLDERQLKLAQRLRSSMANRSPDKVRALQRAREPDASLDLIINCEGDQQSSARDTSLKLLRSAIHDGASRLRSVKNGASLFEQIPSSEDTEIQALVAEYHHARATSLAEGQGQTPRARGKQRSVQHDAHELLDQIKLRSQFRGIGKKSDELQPNHENEPESLYLSYTSRRIQETSPHRQLPSVQEFRAKLLTNKAPVRPLLSATATATSSPADLRMRRSSAIALLPGSTTDRHSTVTFTPPRQLSQHYRAAAPPSVPKVHSVERLQAAVVALDDARWANNKRLAQALASLDQDRYDCVGVKLQTFEPRHHIDNDLRHMRQQAERQRVQHIESVVERNHWYNDLLRHLLGRESPPLHAAERFLLHAIRRFVNEGHDFGPRLFYRLILAIHADDLRLPEVQYVLLYLRKALAISLSDWDAFFKAHCLPEPIEVSERNEAKEEKKHARMAKLRAVVKVNQVLRHLSNPVVDMHNK